MGKNGVHLRVVVSCWAEDVDHLTNDVLMIGIGPLGDLHHSAVVGLAAFQLALGNEDIMDEEIVGSDKIGQLGLP